MLASVRSGKLMRCGLVPLSRIGERHEQLAYPVGEWQAQTEFSGNFERGFQILNLIFYEADWKKIPVDHPLAVKLQDSAFAQAAHDCLANLGRIGSARFRQSQ